MKAGVTMRKIKKNTMKNQAYEIIRKKILNQSYILYRERKSALQV